MILKPGNYHQEQKDSFTLWSNGLGKLSIHLVEQTGFFLERFTCLINTANDQDQQFGGTAFAHTHLLTRIFMSTDNGNTTHFIHNRDQKKERYRKKETEETEREGSTKEECADTTTPFPCKLSSTQHTLHNNEYIGLVG